MKIFQKYSLFFLLGILCGNNLNLRPTFLVLNHFDRKLTHADASLKENFSNSVFEFDSTFYLLFDNIDESENPAASNMNTVKDLGEKHKVNFVLYNKIKHDGDRFMLEGQMFNTRSGGLIYRRKIDLTNYLNGQMNELNMWVGNVTGKIDDDWQKKRESILFANPENIKPEKTPMGAALRSLIVPGWGQSYSEKKVSARVWAGTESALSLAVLFNFLKYDEAAKNYLVNLGLYNNTNDEKEVSVYRAQAESDWNDHVFFSELAIAFVGATGTGWVANSIHAWIVGPRAYKNLYQKWDTQLPDSTG